jgi:hypothetical protein
MEGAPMSTITDAARITQEQLLATVRQSQEAVVDAVATWARAVEGIVPAVPAVPGAEHLPKPEAVVEGAFDFAQKLLDAQRDFARSVISAAAPAFARPATPAEGE